MTSSLVKAEMNDMTKQCMNEIKKRFLTVEPFPFLFISWHRPKQSMYLNLVKFLP